MTSKKRTVSFNAATFAKDRAKSVGESAGLSNINTIMSEHAQADTTEVGKGVYQSVSLDKIDLDPNQPRTESKPTREEVEFLKPLYPAFKSYLENNEEGFNPESLRDSHPARSEILIRFLYLARDIESNGLIHPINVYKSNMRYVLSQGERRYLAHMLIGKSKIPAIERPQPAKQGHEDRLQHYLKQVGENFQREDFSVQEKLNIVKTTRELFSDIYKKEPSGRELAKLLHIGRSTLQRYLIVLDDPTKQQALLNENQSLSKVTETAKTALAPSPAPKTKSKKVGRKPKVDLGKIESLSVVKALMTRIDPEVASTSQIDWSDAKAVQKYWHKMIEKLMKEIH